MCHMSQLQTHAMPDLSLHFANLNKSNYAEWSLYMQSTLIKKGLWRVVEGSESHPLGSPNSKAVKAFDCCQAEAHAEIVLHLEPSQLPHDMPPTHMSSGRNSSTCTERKVLPCTCHFIENSIQWLSTLTNQWAAGLLMSSKPCSTWTKSDILLQMKIKYLSLLKVSPRPMTPSLSPSTPPLLPVVAKMTPLSHLRLSSHTY